MSPRPLLATVVLALAWLKPATSEAYRPFAGTDADTAALGEFELEAGGGFLRELGQRYLETPDTVLNLGIVPDTELVVDFTPTVQLGIPHPLQLSDDDVVVKHVFRQGILQGKTGLSIAAEGGVLLPELGGAPTGFGNGFGGTLDVILSYRWSWTTLHFNEQAQFARDDHLDLFSGVIIEGPQWRVRPVAELYWEREWTVYETESVLLGTIWTLSEEVQLDAAARVFFTDAQIGYELRAGITWTIPVWRPAGRDAD